MSEQKQHVPSGEGEKMFQLMKMLYKPHPWHGVQIGDECPKYVTAYVECVPGEGIKYEVDKPTGYLKVYWVGGVQEWGRPRE